MKKPVPTASMHRMTAMTFATRLSENADGKAFWDKCLDQVRETGAIALERDQTYAGVIRAVRGHDERSAEYDIALQDYAHKIAMECVPIADTVFVLNENGEKILDADDLPIRADTQRDKLKIDTRLKLAGLWDRKRYGANVQIEKTIAVVDDGMLLTGMVELLRLAANKPRLPMVIEV